MSDWKLNFGQNLRHLRQVYGMTQRAMAEQIGVSVSTYGKMERCDPSVRIPSGRISCICDRFGLSTDELLHQNWKQMLEEK